MDNIMDFRFETRKLQSTQFHQEPEIVYVLEGAMEIKVEDDSYKLDKGDFLLINANKHHEYREIKANLLIASFKINYAMLADIMQTSQLLFWCNTVADRNDAYQALKSAMDCILNRFYERHKEGAIYLNSLYYEVVYLLITHFMITADDARMKGNISVDNSRIFEIQNYVQDHYQNDLSLNDLAQKLYLSNTYLSKYIKKHFGVSFLEYVNNVRLFHAVDELVYSDKKITRIALDNGFPTTAAFNRAFKEMYQMTPSTYRHNILNNNLNDLDGQSVEKEELDKRIKAYLVGKKVIEDDAITKDGDLIIVDSKKTKLRKRSFNKMVNMCNMDDLLNYDIQDQILTMQKEIGITYIRFYNLFQQDFYNQKGHGKESYNFSRIDRVLDFLVAHHLKPYIELAFKPVDVNFTIESPVTERESKVIFHNTMSFKRVMRAFASHIANRYGVEEIETWYFELWKDDRLNMIDEDGRYFDCFDIINRAFKTISPAIKLGGAGFALGYDNYQYHTLIRNWKRRDIHPDFISIYSYSYILLYQKGVYFGKRSIDNSFLKNQIEMFKKMLEKEDFHIDEVHITEWGLTISNRNPLNDSCGLGAYIIKNDIECEDEVDLVGYWHGSDIHSEYYDSETVLYGDNGLMTRDGLKKPSFYAFQFLNFLKEQLLGKNKHAILTTDQKGTYTIVCHNCKDLNYRYTLIDEQEIRKERIHDFYEDLNALHLKFQIDNVENGDYIIQEYTIDEEHGSLQDIWKNMGYIEHLSKEELAYMEESAKPRVEMHRIHVNNNTLYLETTLKANAFQAINIHYFYQ